MRFLCRPGRGPIRRRRLLNLQRGSLGLVPGFPFFRYLPVFPVVQRLSMENIIYDTNDGRFVIGVSKQSLDAGLRKAGRAIWISRTNSADFWTISISQRNGEANLIEFWSQPDVPKCVKMAVEALHSQHRRMDLQLV